MRRGLRQKRSSRGVAYATGQMGAQSFGTSPRLPLSDQLAKRLSKFLSHYRGFNIDAGPIFDADDPLVDDHAEAVEHVAAMSFSVANKPGARRIGDDVRNDERRPQAFDIEIQATVNIRVESDRGRVDHDVGFRRNFVSVHLNDELGLSLGLAVEQINECAASAFAPVHHNNARGARQCELHPNRPCSAARTKHDDLLPLRIDDLPERLQESLAVSIFANEFLATANRTVDRSDHHRGIA